MSLLWATLIIATAGAFGGLANALTTGNTNFLPEKVGQGDTKVLAPGLLATVFVGAFAAAVNWGLYGPFADKIVFGEGSAAVKTTIQLSGLVTGALIGFVGAKWLTNEADKKFFKAAAMLAAARQPDTGLVASLAVASPRQALEVASS